MNTEIPINEKNIKSLLVEENGHVDVQDTHGKNIAGFTVKKEKGEATVTFTGTGGKNLLNVKFSLTNDNKGNSIVSGTINGSPASFTASNNGEISQRNPPAKKPGIDPQDLLTINSVFNAKSISDMISKAGSPPPFNPKTEDKVKAGTTGTGVIKNHPIESPLSIHCILAIAALGCVFLAAVGVTAGLAAGAGAVGGAGLAGYFAGKECLT